MSLNMKQVCDSLGKIVLKHETGPVDWPRPYTSVLWRPTIQFVLTRFFHGGAPRGHHADLQDGIGCNGERRAFPHLVVKFDAASSRAVTRFQFGVFQSMGSSHASLLSATECSSSLVDLQTVDEYVSR